MGVVGGLVRSFRTWAGVESWPGGLRRTWMDTWMADVHNEFLHLELDEAARPVRRTNAEK